MKNVDDLYPLTPTQAGMLFQCLRDDDSELYFEQVRGDLHGDLDVDRLRLAFEAVTGRHPALRTAIIWEGIDQPVQAVRTAVELPFEVIELPRFDDRALDRLAAERRRRPFEFEKAPLQRVAIVTAGDGRHHLIWEFHHIICDGWSAAMVLDEVLAHYGGERRSDPATPFRSFLAWHAQQDAEATTAYWKQLLDGFVEPTPILLPRAASEAGFASGIHVTEIAGRELDGLVAFARDHRVTLNTLVQAAWSVTQSRYSGSDDVVFGVTTSGRPAELDDVEHIVGMFLTTLPMRVQTNPAQATIEWLQAIQSQQLATAEHSTASLAELHRQVGVAPGDNLFDTVLVFENYPRPAEDRSAALRLVDKMVFEQTNFPLTLLVGVDSDTLKLVANYDRNRFEQRAIVALMAQFRHALTGLAEAPADTLAGQRFFTGDDIALFAAWQGPLVESARTVTVTSRLIDQALATPDAIALIDGDRTLTFAELMGRAGGVAAELRRHGVGPEVPVGVAVPRTIEMVVALVGTLLAGGAYVPLDPRYPPARLSLMLEVSGAPVVLTVAGADAAVRAARPDPHLTYLDVTTVAPLPDGDRAQAHPGVTPDSTLLLTFTSGSTGVPKGVQIHHAGMLNRFRWHWRTYPLEPGEVSPQKTTLGFVDHLWELWGALLHGNPVLLVDDDVVTDPDALIGLLAAHQARRLTVVPSLLDLLLEHAPDLGTRLPELTMWTTSGEALAVATAERFYEVLPGRTLINLYGMSEVCADVTVIEIEPGLDVAPIGRPIDNMAIHVLDRHDRRVPVGVPGELHASGIGVVPGYWGRPDLTAERFVANPFSEGEPDHARLYRSGDVVRWRADGVVEYLGRSDHQVKVRGVRIELGEVETALASHRLVDRAVVAGRRASTGTELIAYVTVCGDEFPSERELVGHARSLVPDVMVPSRAVVLDDFPLLPNGKVNRSALPDPTVAAERPGLEAPLSKGEEAMLEVWRDVMELPFLGPDDDFFDAGGHSLLAMRLVSRIKRDLGLQIGLAQLLRTGTVRSLVHALEVPVKVDDEPLRYVVPILDLDPRLRNLFIVHGAGGDILTFRALGHLLEDRINVLGVQAAGVDGVSPLHASAEEMVAGYFEEIRRIQPDGPYLLGGFSTGGLIAVELARRLRSEGQAVERLVFLDVFHPSVQPREIPRAEHLQKLFKIGPRYGFQKLSERLERRRRDRVWRKTTRQSTDGPVPYEVRKWDITVNNLELWGPYRSGTVDVPILLFAAEEVFDIWEGMIDRYRGWDRFATDLTVVDVPGDHMCLVDEPHVVVLAERLAAALDV